MTTYLILLGAHAMDHIPDEDMPAVDEAAHAVCQEAITPACGFAAADCQTRRRALWPPTGRSPTVRR